ncbi:hypothetical protein NHF45_02340 [Maricaulaceae bacterium NA33B04]|nr:hypothetical protein [Maricaulaceae bacterium NA33B04]
MILQNISRAIREQNYYAVALEFIIVLAGVVIGFQIQAWNEDRQVIARAEELTERLRDDLAMERLNILDTQAYYDVVIENAEVVARDLSGNRPVSDQVLVIAAFRATQFPSFPRFRSAYDELVSTGTLPLVPDDGFLRVSDLLYGPGIYNAHLSDPGDSEYRTHFRGLVSGHAQRTLRDVCGDRVTPAPPGGRETIEFGFECTLPMPPEVLSEIAGSLRTDPELLTKLQRRIADLDTILSNLDDLLLSMESLTESRLVTE